MKIKNVDTNFLFNFFAASPLTRRGRDSLNSLGIREKVDEDFFFNNIYAKTRFDGVSLSDIYNEKSSMPAKYDTGHPFSKESEDIRKAVALKNSFDMRVTNKADYLLEINGTPGCGKTTEVHHMLRQVKRFFDNKTFNLFYDLEITRHQANIGQKRFTIPVELKKKEYIHWLFFVNCLDSLYRTVVSEVRNKNQHEKVQQNFEIYFNNENKYVMAREEEQEVFNAITSRESNIRKYANDFYDAIDALIDRNNVERSIADIWGITLQLLICIEPDNMNFIVIDNIEQFIKIESGTVIPWYDEDVNKLSEILSAIIGDNKTFFDDDIGLEFSEHFKIISVLRKTSMYASMQTRYINEQCSIDISDWFSFENLYQKRKSNLLAIIKKQDNESELDKVFEVLESLTSDDQAYLYGHSLIEMLSSICNNNIRRIGASISEIAIDICTILSTSNESHISISQFKSFWADEESIFLMRRATIQCLLRKIIQGKDFADLKLGSPRNRTINAETVGVLTRRILVLLSRRSKSVNDDSFVRLHELVKLSYATEKNKKPNLEREEHFKPLADVLCALNKPFYEEPLTAPWIIIRYNENVMPDADMLATALEGAWKDYRKNGDSCNQYPVSQFGARITKSGHFFVSTIHPDFSFFAALYCNEEVPILLLKKVDEVIAQIDRVFNKAREYTKTLNEIDNRFFQPDLKARKSSFGANAYEREHLFLRLPMTEVTLQELIVYRIHMFLVHYQRFLNKHGVTVFGKGNSQLLTHVKGKIEDLEKEFITLKSAGQVVSTKELFSFKEF
ncbi:MAG: hypothetical protein LBL58_19580 [Tannerellaceae bacterium]|jgi:hypothetical protein|nr:hypothetical protein [Tannerellaceae bacterium]